MVIYSCVELFLFSFVFIVTVRLNKKATTNDVPANINAYKTLPVFSDNKPFENKKM